MTITLITPVFNSAETLADCMTSIARQTVPCQHILIDGGSTDASLEVIQEHINENTEWISEPDQGMYDAINKGIAKANGDIIGVLNSDDFYPQDNILELIINAFKNPEINACYGDLLYVDRKNTSKVVRNWKSGSYKRERFYNGWMPPHPTFFIRREYYAEHGGYRLDMGSAADYELMLRMLFKYKLTATYIPQVLVRMRNDGMSNTTLIARMRANRKDRYAWKLNSIKPKPWTMIAKPAQKVLQWVQTGKTLE